MAAHPMQFTGGEMAAERGEQEETQRHWQAILDELPGDEKATAKLAG
jgi:hypothetical protein